MEAPPPRARSAEGGAFLNNPGPPDSPPGAGMIQAPGPGWWWLALKKGPGGEYRGGGQDGQKAGAGGGRQQRAGGTWIASACG